MQVVVESRQNKAKQYQENRRDSSSVHAIFSSKVAWSPNQPTRRHVQADKLGKDTDQTSQGPAAATTVEYFRRVFPGLQIWKSRVVIRGHATGMKVGKVWTFRNRHCYDKKLHLSFDGVLILQITIVRLHTFRKLQIDLRNNRRVVSRGFPFAGSSLISLNAKEFLENDEGDRKDPCKRILEGHATSANPHLSCTNGISLLVNDRHKLPDKTF
jgi:hypothetical protein